MQYKINYVSGMLMKRFIIPELDCMFPNSNTLPEIVFENQAVEDDNIQQVLNLYKEGVITQDEARKEIGYNPSPQVEVDDVAKTREVANAFYLAMEKKPEIAELWQDKEISDSELIRRVRLIK